MADWFPEGCHRGMVMLHFLVVAGFEGRVVRFARVDLQWLGWHGQYKVRRDKSVQYMPFWLSFAGFANGLVWVAYALIQFDLNITIANGTGAILGAIQLLLWTYVGEIYPRCCATVDAEQTDIEMAAPKEQIKGFDGVGVVWGLAVCGFLQTVAILVVFGGAALAGGFGYAMVCRWGGGLYAVAVAVLAGPFGTYPGPSRADPELQAFSAFGAGGGSTVRLGWWRGCGAGSGSVDWSAGCG
ncbi:hypothetical protein QQ045_029907 [Rhodiola kirilowii]